MVNILEELKNSNKKLLEENNQLKERFGVNNNNNLTQAEIRQELIEAVSSRGVCKITDNPDEKIIDQIMTYYPGVNWPRFCQSFPVKEGRQSHIGDLYIRTSYWNKSFEYNKKIAELENKETTLKEQLQAQKKVKESLKKELEEKELVIENLRVELKEAEEGREANLDAIDTCRDWYFTHHINPMSEELANKTALLSKRQEVIERKDRGINELRDELKTERNLLMNARKIIEKKDELIKLSNKPLPKSPSKFKIFKGEVKSKFQQLTEKVKHQSQRLIAKIEVRIK